MQFLVVLFGLRRPADVLQESRDERKQQAIYGTCASAVTCRIF